MKFENDVKAYIKAAERGDVAAQCNLGVCYYNGDGVMPSDEKAAYWFTKAAEQGYAYAQFALGACYEYGKGVSKDCQKAISWYRKAMKQGHTDAKERYDALCRQGYRA